MKIVVRALVALMVLALVTVGMAACGSDSDETTAAAAAARPRADRSRSAPSGPTPTIRRSSRPIQAVAGGDTRLLRPPHLQARRGRRGRELDPGLAESLPKVTNGGKTYKFKLRKGLKYSDGAPVKASDFEHTIKRMIELKGPYSSFYTGIVGRQEFQDKGDNKADISGHRDRRQDRRDHGQAQGAGRQVPVRARPRSRGAGAVAEARRSRA